MYLLPFIYCPYESISKRGYDHCKKEKRNINAKSYNVYIKVVKLD